MRAIKFSLLLFPLILSSCGRPERTFERTGLVMGTVAEIKVRSSSKAVAERALDAAFSELGAVDEAMSAYREGSDIAMINASAGGSPVAVRPETIEVLEEAKRINALSGGAFDITIGPLLDLWGFGSQSFRVPERDEVEAVLVDLLGSDKIEIDGEGGRVRLVKPGMEINLGGVAKGYGVDRAAQALRENRIAGALVNVGGDLYCLGEEEWRVGIRHPGEADKLMARISIKDKAVATSGGYENYFVSNGRRYYHIMDARKGYPADTDVVSVTIIAESCMLADALATTVFILGVKEGMALIEGIPGVDGVIAREKDGGIELSISDDLKGKVEVIDEM